MRDEDAKVQMRAKGATTERGDSQSSLFPQNSAKDG